MVRHALHEVMPTAMLQISSDTKIHFFILFRFLVDKINDLLLAKGTYKDATGRVFGFCAGVLQSLALQYASNLARSYCSGSF